MPLKIAVVGTGAVAASNYIPFLAGQSDVELGLYNRTPEKAQQVAQKFNAVVFSSLKEIADWNPTAVLVLTSETVRYEVTSQLLELGIRRLFFEKPLVATMGQAHVTENDFHKGKALLEKAREVNCETAMIFNYRFFPQSLAAKRIVAERNFGELINVSGLIHFACWSHCIDLIHHFGGSVATITALPGNIERHTYIQDLVDIKAKDVTAAFVMQNGATGTLIGTAGLKWQHPLYELIFCFENGRLHVRDLNGTLEVLDGHHQMHETHTPVRHTSRWDSYQDSFGKSLEAYLDSLRKSTPPPVPGIDGLKELQVEAALKRSIEQRRPVQVQAEFSL